MPVINEEGIVGLVTATSERAARVTLLLDRQTAIDGTVQRSRTRGIVRGRGTELVEFEFVARGGDVEVGDSVITSGLDGVYPKGLRVGLVTAVSEAGAGLLRTATVAPAVDFGRLEQAFVILRRGPSMELLYRTEGGDGEAQAADAGGARP
jgi:rod shape-determining protein MreC